MPADHAITTLRQASRQVVREWGLLSSPWGLSDCSPTECHTLVEIRRAGRPTAVELTARLGLEKSTVSRVVARLEKRGLIVAGRRADDRRHKPLSLTAAGRRQLEKIDGESNGQVGAALAVVTPAERATIISGMELYARALRRARRQEGYATRVIRPADDPAVARIIRDVMTEFGAVGEGYSINDPEIDAMSRAYRGKRSAFYVIARGRKIVGAGGIAPLEGGDPDTCELRKMYFLPEIRGLGLGRALLERCLDRARELGYRRCYLETLRSMTQAQRLYRAAGFVPLAAPEGSTGHFGCNSWMAVELAGPRGRGAV